MASFFETGESARINGGLLGTMGEGSTVCLAGRVTSPGIIQTSDGVELRLEGDDLPGSGVVEVVGTKLNGTCVKTMRVTSLGDDFDLAVYEGLVQHVNGKYRDLFSA
mmetsp:Transcript_4604/g.13998  ORF Transcript_4604/g.13998 Transcript_4604/m.13998 type:complete len:107 (-) Transcript_4604:185-505(-)